MEHFEGIGSAFGYENDEGKVMNTDYKTAYPTDEEPKVIITIEKLHRWNVWESNGTIQQSGMSVKKDTTVYLKDVSKINELLNDLNRKKKQRELLKFKNRKK